MLRAELYHALAESLAEPPDWLALAGYEWPLFEIVTCLAPSSQAARRAVEPLTTVRAEALRARRARYAALFTGPGRPRFWLYESAHRCGRLLGPETFAVERFYRASGLEVASAELPDHASLELAFLAHLAAVGQDSILPNERQFIEQHAGRWLPQLGRALARSGDKVYAPVGQLLADWLEENAGSQRSEVGGRTTRRAVDVTRRPPLVTRRSPAAALLPHVPHAASCTLCGFCAQVCPTRALAVRETANETTLALDAAVCVGCGQCERICETHAIQMRHLSESGQPSAHRPVLRRSPRVICRGCGTPMVSRAELDFVALQIGHPAWLNYCAECRPALLETPR